MTIEFILCSADYSEKKTSRYIDGNIIKLRLFLC